MAGTILLNDNFEKTKRAASLEKTPLETYVRRWQDAADILNVDSLGAGGGTNKMIDFSNALK